MLCGWDKQKKGQSFFCRFQCANIQLFDIVAKHIAKNLAYRTAPGRRLRCKGTMSPVSFIVTAAIILVFSVIVGDYRVGIPRAVLPRSRPGVGGTSL